MSCLAPPFVHNRRICCPEILKTPVRHEVRNMKPVISLENNRGSWINVAQFNPLLMFTTVPEDQLCQRKTAAECESTAGLKNYKIAIAKQQKSTAERLMQACSNIVLVTGVLNAQVRKHRVFETQTGGRNELDPVLTDNGEQLIHLLADKSMFYTVTGCLVTLYAPTTYNCIESDIVQILNVCVKMSLEHIQHFGRRQRNRKQYVSSKAEEERWDSAALFYPLEVVN
ncbi:hypothetical protein T265_06177 [Opisthorchis viverrini]|uniref:Uncharacterized protein n=1 Tax=Opisthorchis viverrini TaxID=6198 RepID=A0A074ZTA1_OPIVI|nr:hypothetical protein T265_06177 [Opisthorchis viverrini]KER26605.1 hypothetical protein T265_06177 [Opisthorchis viverrini]